jgi:hypothetical protein
MLSFVSLGVLEEYDKNLRLLHCIARKCVSPIETQRERSNTTVASHAGEGVRRDTNRTTEKKAWHSVYSVAIIVQNTENCICLVGG